MTEGAGGVIEQLFECLNAGDWPAFSALLSAEVERTGPLGDRVVGRDQYVEYMAGTGPSAPRNDVGGTTWVVHGFAYAPDRRSGFARVTANITHSGQERQLEEAMVFAMDDEGLVSRIEVFWRTPRFDRPSGD